MANAQYNPSVDLDQKLLESGLSKTVYALVDPIVEEAKRSLVDENFLSDFHEAWTKKQDPIHREFFDVWHQWSSPVVDLDRSNFPFFYPTAGASEPLRQLIFDNAVVSNARAIHVFDGEYEGYKAYAEAALCQFRSHSRDNWRSIKLSKGDLFFLSSPSAIDGNVWADLDAFLSTMPNNSVVVDLTYVGAVHEDAIAQRFNMNHPSVYAVVFSLSKSFGVYYDRIGGVFCKKESLALFGNQWFKSIYSLRLGTKLMQRVGVFDIPAKNREYQANSIPQDYGFAASDVFLLAHAKAPQTASPITSYVQRANTLRVCLTPSIDRMRNG